MEACLIVLSRLSAANSHNRLIEEPDNRGPDKRGCTVLYRLLTKHFYSSIGYCKTRRLRSPVQLAFVFSTFYILLQLFWLSDWNINSHLFYRSSLFFCDVTDFEPIRCQSLIKDALTSRQLRSEMKLPLNCMKTLILNKVALSLSNFHQIFIFLRSYKGFEKRYGVVV